MVQKIHNKGGQAIAVATDVSIEAEVLSLFKAAEEKFGAITALVNNAGILEQQSLFQNMSVEDGNAFLVPT